MQSHKSIQWILNSKAYDAITSAEPQIKSGESTSSSDGRFVKDWSGVATFPDQEYIEPKIFYDKK